MRRAKLAKRLTVPRYHDKCVSSVPYDVNGVSAAAISFCCNNNTGDFIRTNRFRQLIACLFGYHKPRYELGETKTETFTYHFWTNTRTLTVSDDRVRAYQATTPYGTNTVGARRKTSVSSCVADKKIIFSFGRS